MRVPKGRIALWLCLAVAAIGAISLGNAPPRGNRDVPEVALLASSVEGGFTELYLQAPGAALSAPLTAFSHPRDAVVRGTVIPGERAVLAVADLARVGDGSFSGTLLRLEPGRAAQALVEGVYYATRPLIRADGRTFVVRGREGEAADSSREYRLDGFQLDEVLPGGEVRTAHRFVGHLLFLAASAGSELVAYRVGPDGAQLAAVDPDSGSARVVTDVLPFARDFSVDGSGRSLYFTNRHPLSPEHWVVERVELDSGEREVLAQAPRLSLLPHAWPGGGLAFNPEGDRGLWVAAAEPFASPLGAGIDTVRALTGDGRWAALTHRAPDGSREVFALRSDGRGWSPVASPKERFVEVAGFVEAAR